jgi:hypothetical protein
MDGTGRLDLALQLHQFCFYPRALLTPSDAVFVAKMIRTMHDLGTPGFNTVFAYMQVSQPLLWAETGMILTYSSLATRCPPAYLPVPRAKRGTWVCHLYSD